VDLPKKAKKKNPQPTRKQKQTQTMDNEKIIPLEFEKPLLKMNQKIEELVQLGQETDANLTGEIARLRQHADDIKQKLYSNLKPSERLQIARHPQRPNFLEVARMLSPDTWIELHGDRGGTDDRAIVGGLIEIPDDKGGQPAMIIGTQKGRNMKDNLDHNFGMANPEGYRKALRLFYHAEKFKMPVITVIDTPGAYPGIDGEEHGIGQAIAFNIREMARLRVPVISLVTGEGCSGGALGIGVANKIYMLEHAVYTVISPEGCASILWRSAEFAPQAAEAMRITAEDLLSFGIIDGIIEEPVGGAHHDHHATGERILKTITGALGELKALDGNALMKQRYDKFRPIGAFSETTK